MDAVASPQKRQDAPEGRLDGASAPQVAGIQAPTKEIKEVKPEGGRRVLIVPKNSDKVIKQSMTNIFQKSEPQDGKGGSGTESGKSGASVKTEEPNLGLEVKSDRWSKGHKEPKQLKPNAQVPVPVDVQMPEDWGKTQYLQPDLQCPPKKRGPKAKATDGDAANRPKPKAKAKSRTNKKAEKVENEKVETEKVEPPATRKRGKRAPDTNPAPSEEPVPPKDASAESNPNKRCREHLLEARRKRLRQKEKAENGKAVAKETEEVASPKEQVDVSGIPKEEAEATAEEKDDPELADAKEAPPEPKLKRRRQEAPSVPEDADPVAERKKRQSRKSAAYHRAFKACEGSLEEKKAAAKAVL